MLIDVGKPFAPAQHRYCSFISNMLEKSGKTRSDFYSSMIAEAGIAIGLETIGVGEAAEYFLESYKQQKSRASRCFLLFCAIHKRTCGHSSREPPNIRRRARGVL